MDFSFSEEQYAIQDTAKRFAQEHLLPFYQQREKEGAVHRPTVKMMGELGLIGAELPEEFGGLGADYQTCGVIIEEIARGDFNLAGLQIMGGLIGPMICEHAHPDLAHEWVPKLIGGEALAAIALTEPHAGSDAVNLQLEAKKSGDKYILNGEKTSITLATQADVTIVFARTSDDGARGVSAFLVPMDLPGISTNGFNDVGGKSTGRGSIFFDNVALPAANLMSEEGNGFKIVMHGFDYSRVLIGMQCLAAALQSLEETWAYVAEREAFGRPIAKFQGVSFPLAEAETHLTSARFLCYNALWLREQGMPHTKEAAMCKWWVPKIAHEIISQCVLLHGHAGWGDDYPHQQRMRDVMGLQIGDGTAQIQKMVIAREVAGKVTVSHV